MTNVNDPRISYRTPDGWLEVNTGVMTPVRFPTVDTVGVAGIPGWTPSFTLTDDNMRITEGGSVVEDVRIVGGSLLVFAPNVTIRRCEVIGGSLINFDGPQINNGMLVEDTTIRPSAPGVYVPANTAVGLAGYTMRRCAIIDTSEGYGTGGTSFTLMDPSHPQGYGVKIYDCFTRIHYTPDCDIDVGSWHGDGIQTTDVGGALHGTDLTIRNSVFMSVDKFDEDGVVINGCGGSSCIDIFHDESQPADVDGCLFSGSVAPFRVSAGGRYVNCYVEHGKWLYFPTAIDPWETITEWECYTCTLDANGQPETIVNTVQFGYPGYGPLDPPP